MAHAWEIFGVSPAGFHRLRAVGYTPAEIGALYGRSRASVANSIVRVCRISADVGVRNAETPTGQAARFLHRRQGSVAGYLDQVLHAPRRGRLGLPPTERGKEPDDRAVHQLALAAPRAASVLPPVPPVIGAPPPPGMPTMYDNFTVRPAKQVLEFARASAAPVSAY